MRCTKHYWIMALIVVSLMMLGSVVSAQTVTQAWAARYNGTGNDKDQATDIATDNSGNVYVTGKSTRSTWDYDCVTIKYNSSGAQQWARTYNSATNGDDIGEAIAVDGSGNVYVTGYSDGDYVTIKYNSSGTQQWLNSYNGPGNGDDHAWDIAVDASGNVFVTGGSDGSGTLKDYATVKYNSSGAQQWAKRYNSANNNDIAYALALQGSYVYVTGGSRGTSTLDDYATLKYQSSNSAQIWVARYNGPSNQNDIAHDIVVNATGVYVTGESYDASTDWDAVTIKYNLATGAQSWANRYDGAGNSKDKAFAIAIDASGNAFVTGYDYGLGGGNRDYLTIKYSSAGTQLWANTYNGAANRGDWAHDVAVDATGNAYVTGECETAVSDEDYVTIKYSATGTQKWVAIYDGPATSWSPDWAFAITVDASSNVYITGQSEGTSSAEDYATVKYTQSADYECGDADGNGIVEVSDAVYLINYIFNSGPAPDPLEAGDVDCNEIIEISDVVYLINYIFNGGPEPCADCPGKSGPPPKRTAPGNAALMPKTTGNDNGFALHLSMDATTAVQGVQLRFDLIGNIEVTEVTGLIDGLQTFQGQKDGYLNVGLLDMTGQHLIESGNSEVVCVKYMGAGSIELIEAIVVTPEARKLDVTISTAKVEDVSLPTTFSLKQNMPNPFNPTTQISYTIPVASAVHLGVFNTMGQRVATLVDEYKAAGSYTVTWDSRVDNGAPVASGVYFYRLSADNFVDSKKMLLLK